uniref:ubiquitin-like domain-containing protein CIP73 isoform X2 n=1 Tax=Erigeron canadensis TaxID=72917 RepID=UPI001CB8DFBB|nr:ubiquitin-like domain-containing protein CIP73 isoform X2 [Erigeron canadensis]
MASNHGGKDAMDVESSEGNNTQTTVEIKIKTLDSQTYTLRVDKCVPVPALKEQIASVTGVVSEQQRLICRGKVLKDDQLLSAYHVEDGHTLHLVARQPISPLIDHAASDPASSTRQSMGSQHGPSVVLGTFNISEQGDGSVPDLSRIVSAVLRSIGAANASGGGESVSLQQHISESLSRIPGLNEIRSSSGQPEEASFTLPADVSLESLQLPVIPDSLSTLSQYLRRLRNEFNENVGLQGNTSQSLGGGSVGEDSHAAPHLAAGLGCLPTPASLGEVTQSTRQLLIEQVGECLVNLTRQLGDQTNVNNPMIRVQMQSYALRTGALLQNLGAFLLELGRTTMTLRLGQSPTNAVVNAGPAVFISTSGPNPIMVQPLPFQPGTSFGTTPMGAGTSFPVGSGLRSRNIDIRIRTGSVLASGVDQRDAHDGERPATESAASDGGVSNNQASRRTLPQSRGGSDVRVVPIRISSLPLGLAPSGSTRTSMSVVYPVLARAQHVDSGNVNGINGRASNGTHTENRAHVVFNSAAQQQPPEVPGLTEVPHGLHQLLRNFFPGESIEATDIIFEGVSSEPVGTAQTAVNSQETSTVTDQGTFLANLLHQIMPVVSQHINGVNDGSSVPSVDAENGATQPSSNVEESQGRGASSRHPGGPSSSPTPKRRKTE